MRFEIGDMVTWDDYGFNFNTERVVGQVVAGGLNKELLRVLWFGWLRLSPHCPWAAVEDCYGSWLRLHDKELC